ncbi:hypothetical protein [Ignavibacterium sp.]|uniref:hypothetical protein n=1 Tax=Ignavibacterium sp. TaxID=2651167 RepID=UPI00307E3704
MKRIYFNEVDTIITPYFAFKDPLIIYDNSEEFLNSEHKDKIVVSSLGEMLDYLYNSGKAKELKANEDYTYLSEHVWIKTPDKYIPKFVNNDGQIIYETDENGEKIPTDGCYIQLLFVRIGRSHIELGTSSGVHYVSYYSWRVHGGVQRVYSRDMTVYKQSRSVRRLRALELLKKRKRPSLALIKFAFAFLSSDSESFLDINRSFMNTLRNTYKLEDLEQVISTKAFREAIMSVVRVLYPSLSPALRKIYDPEKVSEMISEMWDISKQGKDAKQMLEIFKAVIEYAYAETEETKSTRTDTVKITLPDYNQIEASNISENKELPSLKEELASIKDSLSYPDAYIMPDDEEYYDEPEPKDT